MDQIATPEPQTSTPKEVVYRSACRMCHGGCGVLVHVSGGRIVKIRGDPDSPLNKGKMCRMGAASMEHVYSPDRLKYPQRRKGARGAGQWQRISWDEAYDEIAARLHDVIDAHGAEAVWIGTGTGRHHFPFVSRFANALGTPNWCEPGTAQCFRPRVNASYLTFGDFPICNYTEDTPPELIVFWGHNPLYSGPDGEVGFSVRDGLSNGPRTIVVDPRRTYLAKKADLWLQLRPGTDDALALAMLNVIIGEGLYDAEFVAAWTHGFDALAERVTDCTPEWAAPITWVPAEKIRAAARLYAATRPSMMEWGCALEHTPKCIQTVRAVMMLPTVTGNIDVPGGWAFGMHALGRFPHLYETMSEAQAAKRLGADRFKVLGAEGSTLPSAHIASVFKAMRTGDPYWIKAGLIFGNNALATYANSKQVYQSLMKLDTLVVADLYMTPTAEIADMVLPAASWAELDEVVGVPFVAQNVVLAQQKTVQIGECRQDELIMCELARKMGLEHGTETPEQVYDQQLGQVLGITFAELKQKGFVKPPFKYHKYTDKGRFDTPTGKIEIWSTRMEAMGYDPLPHYEEPPESPLSTPELAGEYPLILTSGARIPFYFNTEYRQLPTLRKARPDPEMEIHPDTAAEAGIEDGDWVWIETRRGKCRQKAKLTDGIDRRVVHIQHGWWFPEEPGPEHGIWKSNANLLTSNDPPYDPAMGTYQLRALMCKVARVDAAAG